MQNHKCIKHCAKICLLDSQIMLMEKRGYNTRVYPEVSGLDAWSKNCKQYSSLPLGTVVSFFESV
jgi:hypothetical protein